MKKNHSVAGNSSIVSISIAALATLLLLPVAFGAFSKSGSYHVREGKDAKAMNSNPCPTPQPDPDPE